MITDSGVEDGNWVWHCTVEPLIKDTLNEGHL